MGASEAVAAELDELSERELLILRAAYHVMARIGGHRLNLQHIADEAGTSKGLVLYHFGTKSGVLQRAMQWALLKTADRISDALEAAREAGTDELEALIDAIFVGPQANRDFHLVYLDLVERACREEEFAELPAMTRDIVEAVYAGVVADGVERGAWEVDDVAEAALLVRSVIDGAFMQWLQTEDWRENHGVFRDRCHATLRTLLGAD